MRVFWRVVYGVVAVSSLINAGQIVFSDHQLSPFQAVTSMLVVFLWAAEKAVGGFDE